MAYTLYKNLTTVNRTVMNKTNKYIVIHYTGNQTDTAKANANYFKSVNRSASAHYFVDATDVYQVVEDKDSAWAVGKNYGSNNLFNTIKNNNSISIEMCSTNGAIAGATFDNTVALTKELMKKYNIPASNVVRHFDVCSKKCPGWTGWLSGNETLWNNFKSNIGSQTATATSTPVTQTTQTATRNYLQKGDRGQEVKDMQYKLCLLKHKCDVDGIFGADTERKLIDWQQENHLTADGKYGDVSRKTMDGIFAYLATLNQPTTTQSGYSKTQFIKDVQSAIGAKVDGIAGNETLSKTVTVSSSKNRKHPVVKPIQKYLNYLGYSCGTADGIAGAKFDSAAKSFQKSKGCIADGEITAKCSTWKKLLGLA